MFYLSPDDIKNYMKLFFNDQSCFRVKEK